MLVVKNGYGSLMHIAGEMAVCVIIESVKMHIFNAQENMVFIPVMKEVKRTMGSKSPYQALVLVIKHRYIFKGGLPGKVKIFKA